MTKTYLAVLFILFYTVIYAQDTTKILFIGNSLTYFNQMPQTVQKMFEESGRTVKVYQKTAPGMNLKTWLDIIMSDGDRVGDFQLNRTTFRQEKFNYIILQEATIRLLVPHLREEFLAIIHTFKTLADESSGQLLFYQPYPAYQYPQTYCLPDPNSKDGFTCSDKIVDSDQELTAYARICTEIMQEDSVQIVPIGRGFEEVRKTYTAHNLLADEQHPSPLGSYLIAYTIYRSLLKENYLQEFSFIQDIDKNTAKDIFGVIDKIVRRNRY